MNDYFFLLLRLKIKSYGKENARSIVMRSTVYPKPTSAILIIQLQCWTLSLSPVAGLIGQLRKNLRKKNKWNKQDHKNWIKRFSLSLFFNHFPYLFVHYSIVALVFWLVKFFYQSISLWNLFFVCYDLHLHLIDRLTKLVEKILFLLKIYSKCQLGGNDFRKNFKF